MFGKVLGNRNKFIHFTTRKKAIFTAFIIRAAKRTQMGHFAAFPGSRKGAFLPAQTPDKAASAQHIRQPQIVFFDLFPVEKGDQPLQRHRADLREKPRAEGQTAQDLLRGEAL